jgi:hypothetical protein
VSDPFENIAGGTGYGTTISNAGAYSYGVAPYVKSEATTASSSSSSGSANGYASGELLGEQAGGGGGGSSYADSTGEGDGTFGGFGQGYGEGVGMGSGGGSGFVGDNATIPDIPGLGGYYRDTPLRFKKPYGR